MRKFKKLGKVLALAFILTACSGNNDVANVEPKTTQQAESQELVDKTVEAKNVINIEDYTTEQIIESETLCSDYSVSSDIEAISEESTNVIRGTVENVTYTSVNGDPWTQIDVVVSETFKGDIASNDIVSIYIYGGYVSLEEHIKYYKDAEKFNLSENEISESVIRANFDDEEFPVAGAEGIFFLIATPSDSPLPNGVYERVCGKYSELKYNEQSQEFERDQPDASGTENEQKETFTIEEIEETIEK